MSSSRTAVTPPPLVPITSVTVEFQSNSIFGLSKARCCMIFEARSSSRRWTTVTVLANLVRKTASSIAVSPPPTTTTFLSRKKKPSQVAQADTPKPISSASDGRPSSLAEAPDAMISASQVQRPCCRVSTENGRWSSSIR